MVSVEGFVPGLRELLKRADAPGLVTEVAWMTAYATASQPRHLKPSHLLQPLLALLPAAVQEVQARPDDTLSAVPSFAQINYSSILMT